MYNHIKEEKFLTLGKVEKEDGGFLTQMLK